MSLLARLALIPLLFGSLLFGSRDLLAQIPIGKPIPDLEWETVFESDPEGLAACRGKLVLLYFIPKGMVHDREETEKINGWYELFKKRGLLVIAVFKQDTETLDKWVEEHKIRFPVVSGPKIYKELKVAVLPAYYLISGDGIVLERDWAEKPDRARIEGFLARHVAPLDIPKGGVLGPIHSAWNQRRFHEVKAAIAEARKASSGDKDLREAIDKAQGFLDGQMQNVGSEIKLLAKGPDYHASDLRLGEISKQFKGLSIGKKAEEIKRGFRKDKRIQKEIKAIKKLRQMQKSLKPGDERSKAKLIRKLRKFISKHRGMGAARLASDLLQTLY